MASESKLTVGKFAGLLLVSFMAWVVLIMGMASVVAKKELARLQYLADAGVDEKAGYEQRIADLEAVASELQARAAACSSFQGVLMPEAASLEFVIPYTDIYSCVSRPVRSDLRYDITHVWLTEASKEPVEVVCEGERR